MQALLQLSPLLVVMTLIILLRRPPIYAAITGCGLTFILWLAGSAEDFSGQLLQAIISDGSLLLLSVGSVIIPGLLFVVLVEQTQANKALTQWIAQLGWQGSNKIIFLLLGLAPALESMTGFGVSLIATVPLLLAFLSRKLAVRLALLGMCIMPWGTLGLAIVIGSVLSGIPANILASWTALTSLLVFTSAMWLALWLTGQRQFIDYLLAGFTALIFITLLYLFSRYLGPEIAGVSAGGSVFVIGLLWAKFGLKARLKLPRAIWPYLTLLAIVLSMKIANSCWHWDQTFVIKGSSISWKPLTSPGIALLATALILIWRQPNQALIMPFYQRTKKPVATLFLFLIMSQIMVKAGFLSPLIQALNGLQDNLLLVVSTFSAATVGYITGSAVGGIAIIMPSLPQITISTELLPILAANQSSATAHAALGSLPNIALLMGLIKGNRLEEQSLIRFGFLLALANTVLVALSSLILANA